MKMAGPLRHIEIIIQQLNKFHPENENVGHFLNESAKVLQPFKVTDEIPVPVMAILCGCLEYKTLLDVVVDAFYIRDGKHCLFSERNMYIVICYLATFRLEELGLQQFSKIIKSMETAKICKFLRFFFNLVNLQTWIKDEWSHIYDSDYVNENWIEPLEKWQPKIQQLISQLDNIADKHAITLLKTTQPNEFHLTVPNPRAILIPEQIPRQEKTKPVPKNTYKPPRMKQHLERIKLKNRQQAEELLLEANINQFNCAAPKFDYKSSMKETLNLVEKFEAQKIKYKTDSTPVKLNAAAILREGVLYQRKVEQELKRVEHLLQGAQDPSKFLEWQQQMHKKDLDQQLTEAECRKLQGKLSYEEAILARQYCIQEKKKNADQKREEAEEMRLQYAERCLQERKEKEKKAQQVAEGHKNVKQAQMKLHKCKQQIVQEVSKKSEDMLLQVLKDEEEKFKKRYELIQQIRAIEYVPFLKNKFIDLTKTGNHGVLGEMSIVELQERLALLKESQQKAEEEKRDLIIHEKHAKEQLLLDTLDQICMFREQFGRAAALKQEEKKTKVSPREAILKEEQVLDLQKKIMEKSTERKMQSEYLKTKCMKSNGKSKKIWKLDKKSQGEDRWKKLEESRQQQFKMLQHGLVSRDNAQKMMLNEALRTGTTVCILRQDF
ncbi:PREDICTED: cilia- and flagella-associated protein 99 isoform X1 [Thamnophis sirtalis]|uniref:Cilia- and flagella-associated protein 99 isoform X1 n=1 Tax=Thamnophis sirtalis TaxID=35019 RepID=A0A6I9Y5T0_9SAUR|nr:PREDICTED: cilia- and flagella-associated protein 99 isoform X1 [Thamnophis sirtalis]